MRFDIKADTAVFVDGKIKAVTAGEFETTDKGLIEALSKAKGVAKITQKAKPKPETDQE